jgi:hypothetical protein
MFHFLPECKQIAEALLLDHEEPGRSNSHHENYSDEKSQNHFTSTASAIGLRRRT